MTAHLQPSIWTLEIDGKPTLAFEAKKYREADDLYRQEWLRVELSLQKFNDVPLCGADSDLRLRLARPAEMVLYRHAVEADKSSDDSKLVSARPRRWGRFFVAAPIYQVSESELY
jgi:hypothetical protein